MKKFILGDYIFTHKLNKLLKYFNSNNIEYKIINKELLFKIKLDNILINCLAIIKDDKITKFTFKKECVSDDESDKLKDYITSKYKKCYTFDDRKTVYDVYIVTSHGYKYLLRLYNLYDFQLEVSVEKNNEFKLFKHKLSRKDVIELISVILYSILGLFLTIQFIYMYENNYDSNILLICAIISYLYMASAIFILACDASVNIKNKILWPIFLPIIYVAIVTIVLMLISGSGTGFLDMIFWSIYSMPAFLIVVGLGILFMIGN